MSPSTASSGVTAPGAPEPQAPPLPPARSTARERIRSAFNKTTHSLWIYTFSIVIVIIIWQVAAYRFHLLLLFPPPSTTFKRLFEMLLNGSLEWASLISLRRIMEGFLIGSVAGTGCGLLLGTSRTVRALAEPYVHFFRFVPPLAWFAPVLLWFGTGEAAKVLLIVYTTVFVVTLNAMVGVAAVPRNKLRMARAFGASPSQIFFLVVLPASAPYIFTGMRIAMGNSFMTVVAAEMLAASDGLGYLINSGVLFLDTTTVFSGVIALGALGFAADRAFQWVVRRLGGRFTAGQFAFK